MWVAEQSRNGLCVLDATLLISRWFIGGCGKGRVYKVLREDLLDDVEIPVLEALEKPRHSGVDMWGRRFGDIHHSWRYGGLEALKDDGEKGRVRAVLRFFIP